jgi:hypothetical protein
LIGIALSETAIHLPEEPMYHWYHLSQNPSAIHLFEKEPAQN